MRRMLTRVPTPAFWYGGPSFAAKLLPLLLHPFSCVYAAAVRQRFGMHHPIPMDKPVICVGNAVAGGAGKTPVVMALTALLQNKGWNPHLLSRGYGGREEGPLQVSPARDTADDVGDEALLLVEAAPTWVSRNRPLGVQAAIDTGATVIIMDDGYQNPLFFKDVSVLVIDGASGLGNGRVLPAGPLREDFSSALSRCDIVVIVGDDQRGLRDEIARRNAAIPVFAARLGPVAGAPDVRGQVVYAFAGIGRPEKFRETLQQAGADVEGWAEFPDHYPYTEEDLRELMSSAAEKNVAVYTTAKDHVRLPPAMRDLVKPFNVEVVFDDPEALAAQVVTLLELKRGTAW